MSIKTWSTTPASNNSAPPNGAPEGMAPSTVNDVIRQNMADIRTQCQENEWFDWGDTPSRASAAVFKIATNVTTRYLAGRRIKCFDASTFYATIASSSYSAPDTTINLTLDSGALTASLTGVALAILSPTNRSIPEYNRDTLTVSGVAQFQSTVSISGAATFLSTVGISGAATFQSTVSISGAAIFQSTVGITGTTSASVLLLTTPLALGQGGSGAALTLPLINKVVKQTFTASGTYTPTTGMKYVVVEGVSGGGGGGGSTTAASSSGAGGGGASGAYSKVTLTAAQVGASQVVTIGAAGTGSAGAAGTAGTTTSLGTLLVIPGGGGGARATAGTGAVSTNGGVPVITTTGDIISIGMCGLIGHYSAGAFPVSGNGGATVWGSGGSGRSSIGPGSTALGYGGGGGGGVVNSGSAAAAGGDGAPGAMYITEYCSI